MIAAVDASVQFYGLCYLHTQERPYLEAQITLLKAALDAIPANSPQRALRTEVIDTLNAQLAADFN